MAQINKAEKSAAAARNDYREERKWLAATPQTRRYLKKAARRADRRAGNAQLRAD